MGKKRAKTETCKRLKLNGMTLLSTLVLILSLFAITSDAENSCSSTNACPIDRTGNNEDAIEKYEPFDDYNSSLTSNNAGMEGVYTAANSMIESLIPDILPKGWITVENGGLHVKDNDYLGLLEQYMGYLIFLCVLLVFALVVPIVGLCFCCCRCCGKCGSKVETSDKRGDFWPKVVLSSLLLVINILFLFGMVGAFGTNEQLRQGTDQLMDNVDVAINDALAYFTDVSQHANHIVQNNLLTFSTNLSSKLGRTGDILFEEVAKITNMDFVYEVLDLTEKFEPIKKRLENLDRATKKIKLQALQMNDATSLIRYEMMKIANSCPGQTCDPIIGGLGNNLDLNKFPDVDKIIDNMDVLDVEDQIKEGVDDLEEGKDKVKQEINTNVEMIQIEIAKITTDITDESANIMNSIEEMREKVNAFSKDNLGPVKEFIGENNVYLYTLGLLVSIMLLLIAACIFAGLTFGFFGWIPVRDSNTFCNKSVGNAFLVTAAVLMFLTATIMAIVLIVNSLAIFPKLLLCEPLRNPDDSEVMQLLSELLNFDDLLEGADVTSVFAACERNESAYVAFNVKAKFDICLLRDKIDEVDIDSYLEEIETKLKDIDLSGFINDLDLSGVIDALNAIKDTNLGEINENNFEINFDNIDLEALSNDLEILETNPIIGNKIRPINLRIKAYIQYLLQPMKDNAEYILDQVKGILEELNSGNGFDAFIDELILKIGEIKDKLGDIDFATQINPIITDFSTDILCDSNTFVEFTIDTVEHDMGKCKPFSNSVNSLLVATCDNIFQPMNGFWFSIFWCLVMYVPLMILSLKLGSLYKKIKVEPPPTSDYYPMAGVEGNHLNGGYNQRFNPTKTRDPRDYYY